MRLGASLLLTYVLTGGACCVLFSCTGSQFEERLQTVRTGIRDTGQGLVRGRALLKAMCEPLPPEDGTPAAPTPKECPELYEVFDAIQGGYKLANDNVP